MLCCVVYLLCPALWTQRLMLHWVPTPHKNQVFLACVGQDTQMAYKTVLL